MDQAEFIATLAILFELENPQFDVYKDLIKREQYFKGFEKEKIEYFKRKAKKKALENKKEDKDLKKNDNNDDDD